MLQLWRRSQKQAAENFNLVVQAARPGAWSALSSDIQGGSQVGGDFNITLLALTFWAVTYYYK